MERMTPKVSIIIPVFNGANFMRQAIDSALQQTYSNIEIIVVNDGSTDNGATQNIALSYGRAIHYIPLSVNRGGAAALNIGIKNMTGEYFSWLSHDDLYLPNKVEAQIQLLQQAGGPPAAVYANWINIDGQGNELGRHKVPSFRPGTMQPYLYLHRAIHGCSMLVPRQVFNTVGMFDESLRSTADYDMWLRMIPHYHFLACEQFLVKGRSHAEQYTYKAPDHDGERARLCSRYMPLLSREALSKAMSREQWPAYIFQLTSVLASQGYDKVLIKWLQHLNTIMQDEPAALREQMLAGFLVGAITQRPPDAKTYIERLARLSKLT
jgi:glycosyltransferase involved in cell wall biosynthesis